MFDKTKWYRTCQECGHKQNCSEPNLKSKVEGLTDSYRNSKCKKCHSEALDYGTFQNSDSDYEEKTMSENELNFEGLDIELVASTPQSTEKITPEIKQEYSTAQECPTCGHINNMRR